MTTLNDSHRFRLGGVDWTFSIQDGSRFPGRRRDLDVTYDVTVLDGATSSTQTVTIALTGAEDPLMVNPLQGHRHADTVRRDTGASLRPATSSRAGDSARRRRRHSVRHRRQWQRRQCRTIVAGAYGTCWSFRTVPISTWPTPMSIRSRSATCDRQFTFTVTDSFGHSEATTLTFNVQGANDAAVITGRCARHDDGGSGPTVSVNGGFETGDLTGWASSGVTPCRVHRW